MHLITSLLPLSLSVHAYLIKTTDLQHIFTSNKSPWPLLVSDSFVMTEQNRD